ncbi:MAG: phage/plasmid primase, P4 family [Planctomycetota bacterium]
MTKGNGSPAGAPRPDTMPAEMQRAFDERREQLQKAAASGFDSKVVTELFRFYSVQKASEIEPTFCASFLRDLAEVLLPADTVATRPAFAFDGYPQAQILPRATPGRLQQVRENVPGELRLLNAWVAGERTPRFVKKIGTYKSSKVPLNPHTGAQAKSNDPATWGSFEQAAAHAQQRIDSFGVGVNLLGSDYLGLDLDDVLDPTTGELAPLAALLLEQLPPTYTEVSPSGRGLRLFYRGSKPQSVRRSMLADAFSPGTGLEIYDGTSGARYLTVTGQVWEGRGGAITEVDDADLQALVELFGPAREPRREKQGAELAQPTTTPDATPGAPDAHDLARARWGLLEARLLDPDKGYTDWFRVLPALKPWDDTGRELAVQWSRQSEDFDEQEIRDKWPGIDGTGIGCLFGMFDDAAPGWRAGYDREHATEAFGAADDAGAGKAVKLPELGKRTDGKLVLSNRRTLPTAKAFVREFAAHADGRTLHCHAGQFYRWDGSRYVAVEELALRNQLQPWLHDAWMVTRKRDDEGYYLQWRPFDAHSGTIKQALDAVRDHVHIPATAVVPSWMTTSSNDPPPDEILACKSMMLHIPTGAVLQPTPRFFNTCALTFDYDAEAETPARWIEFLDEVFDGDTESIELLQEWMGYLLTPDTSQQKILLMVGPRRSGKGTIARVLRELVGPDNVASPTTTGLSGVFGLQPLIGKSLAVVSDARFHGEGVATVVERMLCISGEDAITIDRKYLGSVTMKLPTRFMILSNEIPRLHDNSTALAGRFLILQLRRSFYGQEDVGLTDQLISELPGILNWALEGWSRLQTLGHFVAPATSNEATAELEDLGSPVGAFVRENCIVGAGCRVDVDILYSRWQQWCLQDGRSMSTTKTTFGRDLRAVVPRVKRRRGTEDRTFYEGVGLQRANRAGP